jgi:curved DNA-binding protein CbpA
MATGTRVRDWATVDFYAVLGVAHDATEDEIATAFRALAKQLHPDARLHDSGTAAQFNDVAAAYAVLGDPRHRAEYDRVRANVRPIPSPTAAATPAPSLRSVSTAQPAPTVRKPWSRRRCSIVFTTGVALTVLGIVGALVTWSLHTGDADRRDRFVPVQATRVVVDGKPYVAFVTDAGQRIVTAEPRNHGDPVARGYAIDIRYDPDDPSHVMLDASTFGRDITLAVVALKLLIGGPVFIVVGLRRLRRAASTASTKRR